MKLRNREHEHEQEHEHEHGLRGPRQSQSQSLRGRAFHLIFMLLALGQSSAKVEAEEAIIRDTDISYVMEPFDSIDDDWFFPQDVKVDLNVNVNVKLNLNLNVSLSEDALFGSHALLVDVDFDFDFDFNTNQDQNQNQNQTLSSAEFGWVLPDRPHNCHGATHFSIWVKSSSSVNTRMRVALFDDTVCRISNQLAQVPLLCADPLRLDPHVIMEHTFMDNDDGDWQEFKVDVSAVPDLDLSRLRGWKIQLENDLGQTQTQTQTQAHILIDHLACYGGGDMLGAAFNIGTDTLQNAIQEGTWVETYYQSQVAANYTIVDLQDGTFTANYMVEQVEAWGGFTDYVHLAPGAAYYNLSQATDLVLYYNVNQAASIPDRTLFRLVLQDTSHCEEGCDTDYHASERWYSFHSILDQQGQGKIVVPLQGSIDPSTPFWLTGWSGIRGNELLDIHQLKGFTFELVLDSELQQGSAVTGSVSFSRMAAGVASELSKTPMSYVMEPFEVIDQRWVSEPRNDLATLNMSISNNAHFGAHSLKVEYSAVEVPVNFSRDLQSRAHNCFGADYISVWYKTLQPGARLKLSIFEGSTCLDGNQGELVECSDPILVFDEELLYSEEWTEIRMIDLNSLDLRRLRGWQFNLVNAGTVFLDQLACVGSGSMMGSSFFPSSASGAGDASWMATHYQSIISQNRTKASFQGGQLAIDYTVEQVEAWGGFTDFVHLAPGAAYYNLSQATDLILSYDVKRVSSNPGRAIVRLVLQDNSDCEAECDIKYHAQERWYSFHSILDEEGPGQIILPLEGSTDPATPFWLTGWSGIIGNSNLDLANIKGFTLEVVLDSVLPLGSLVAGSITFSDLAVVVNSEEEPEEERNGYCVLEDDLQFFEAAPQFKRIEFLGAQCCEICSEDPDCLYAISTGRDCLVASYVDPKSVGLINNENEQSTLTSFWMDDPIKRGNWCDRCECRENDLTIDCKGRDLAILPKTFDQSWIPKALDLRENPKLILLGSGSLSEIDEGLEEMWLPTNMKHIAPKGVENLPKIQSVFFEGDQNARHYLYNTITKPSDFFLDVCCGLGSSIGLSTPEAGLTFCNMQIAVPGVDSQYEPFVNYIDSIPLQVLSPSSKFMSEAAESVEKCAEFCTINSECEYFSYDARLPNSEHSCHLLINMGSRAEYVCCEADHYADESRTIPGWISGRPPQTRHKLDNVKVVLFPQNHVVSDTNFFQTTYELSLGSNPIRGSVWVVPTVVSTAAGLDVKVAPSRVVLYDANQTATVTVTVLGVTSDSPAVTLVIQNAITSCDEAFMVSTDSSDNMVYIGVIAPEAAEDDVNLALAVGIPIGAVSIIVILIFLHYDQKRKENDSVWIVRKDELKFDEPPEIIGRGTFGLVLLGEYRGTQVAVKRVIPPRGKKTRGAVGSSVLGSGSSTDILASATGLDSGSYRSASDGSTKSTTISGPEASHNVGMISGSSFVGDSSGSNHDIKKETSSGHNVGKTSWGGLSSGLVSQSGFSSALSSILSVRKSAMGRLGRRTNDAATWRKLRNEFVEEMRYLSKLRHPCVTTVMGAVLGNGTEPMLVMEYMDHGSLYDLLHNETMIVEGELLLPILRDISQGVRFLHAATPQVLHGDLKAQNILVDSKFRAKVADFGLSQKKNLGGTGTPFWMAPELLRGESTNTAATDVYSFGIILYEVYSRRDPYEGENPLEVLGLIADRSVRKRPTIPKYCPSPVQSLMTDCLVDEADNRPSFEELDTRLKRIDVKDVESRQVTNKASSISLFDIFPRHIAEALRDGRTVEAEHRDVVTIFFSDIIGFTSISSDLPPKKVAGLLDRLYTKFDELSRKHDVFKVETIGDAYMAVTNLVKDQPSDHVKRMAEFAIDAVKAASGTYVDLEDHGKGFLSIRVGLHSGPCVADVVGTRNPRYCLFGDSVNTASRMETNSKANRIHCSSASADILMEQCPGLPLRSRGLIAIKGKGEMHTHWVNEEGARRRASEIVEKPQPDWTSGQDVKGMEPLQEESHLEFSSEFLLATSVKSIGGDINDLESQSATASISL